MNKKELFFQMFLILLSIIFVGFVMLFHVLSFFYLLLVIVILFVINMLFFFILKKKRSLGYLFYSIFDIILLFLIFNMGKTVEFLSGLDLNYKTFHYSVIVLRSSDYYKLNDISYQRLGYYDDGSSESEKSLRKVKKSNIVSYEDTHKLAEDLLNGKIDAVLFEETYLDILNESMIKNGVHFQELIRQIYHFSIMSKTLDISKDINVTKEPFNIYISGIDTFGEISSVSRSDVNMIATVNPKTKQILLTSIPRDYYVQLHGKGGYRDKLTHAGLYGIDMSIQTLEDLLGIEINYYVKANFSSVIRIVETLHGVKVYSDYDFTSIDHYHYIKGYNDLNGEEALSFARERKAFVLGDRQRIINQQALLKGMIDKVLSKDIIIKYSRLLDSVQGSFVTNMKMARITALIRLQLAKNDSWNLVTNHMYGDDSSNYTYSASSVKSYVMNPSKESINDTHTFIEKVLDGEILDKEDVTVQNSQVNHQGLKIRLGRSKVQFVEGDTFIYYGYTATYQGEDVTHHKDLKEMFSIQGKNIDDYKELVLYVSGLDVGKYTITYTISYLGEMVSAKQDVIVVKNDNFIQIDED